MPTHTVPSIVIKLWILGIPWTSAVWQAITGVKFGLFPEDPNNLPTGLTPDDSRNVKSYFDQFSARPTEESMIAFASQRGGAVLPGRKIWRDWINSIWKSAKIHNRITAAIAANNCHPLSLALVHADGEITWPMGSVWLPLCLDSIGIALFGREYLDPFGRLRHDLRIPTQALAQRTWMTLTKRLTRCKKRSSILEQEANEAFNGDSFS